MVALILLTTLTAFSDLLKLATSSKQETLKYLTHICVLFPLIATFVCQPKFIAKVLSEKRPQRVALSDHLPSLAVPTHLNSEGSLENGSGILVTRGLVNGEINRDGSILH